MRRPAKILVVEDHADIRHLVRLTLEFEPCEILEAPNAEVGLAMAQAHRPDLVLLDVMMPGSMNGLDLCARLSADPDFGEVPIVMLSARGNAADREAGLRAGAQAYLVKPFSPMALLELVNRLLEATSPEGLS